MPSNYVGNAGNGFSDTLPMVVDGDSPAAQLWRVPEQALLDNDCYLKGARDSDLARRLLQTRTLNYVLDSGVSVGIGAIAIPGKRKIVVVDAKQSNAYGDNDYPWAGGTITHASTAIVRDVARSSASGRLVVVGVLQTGPAYNAAYSDDEGATWTLGGTMTNLHFNVVYDATHDRFISNNFATPDISYSADHGTTWTAVTSVFTGSGASVTSLAGISGGVALACCSNFAALYPHFIKSTDGGSTWATAGAVPNASTYSEPGYVASAGGSVVYHAATLNHTSVICSTPDGATWTVLHTQTWSLNASSTRILCDRGTGMLVCVARLSDNTFEAITSVDGGATWLGPAAYTSDQTDSNVLSFALAGGRLFFITGTSRLLTASDGQNW